MRYRLLRCTPLFRAVEREWRIRSRCVIEVATFKTAVAVQKLTPSCLASFSLYFIALLQYYRISTTHQIKVRNTRPVQQPHSSPCIARFPASRSIRWSHYRARGLPRFTTHHRITYRAIPRFLVFTRPHLRSSVGPRTRPRRELGMPAGYTLYKLVRDD